MREKFNRASMVKVRGGYSDRNGFNPVCKIIQVEDFDDRTRVILSNEIFQIIDLELDLSEKHGYDKQKFYIGQGFLKDVLSEVFGEVNYFDGNIFWKDVFKKIDNVICCAVVNEVLDIIEFICVWLEELCEERRESARRSYVFYDEPENDESVFSYINSIFERECIGYRFVNGEIIKNVDKTEITTIEDAANTDFDGCSKHIQKATHCLYNRENPDYKNSIKESISAVESICQVITGDSNATLGKALKRLEDNGVNMHSAMKSAFSSLYGYTSDKGGIRHAEGLFASDVSFEEAKYMLVSCCAFVNYLIAEYGKLEG